MRTTGNDFHSGRHAGVLLPLFSFPGRASWGIGEIGDLAPLCSWLLEAGLDFLLLLPVNEMAGGQHSPYSAVSAMALDPVYISLRDVEDFVALGGEASLDAAETRRLEAVRRAPRVEYDAVRALKARALRASFERFVDVEWRRDTLRAGQLRAYAERERWWLDDYVLFRALRERHGLQPWWTWADDLARRAPPALAAARRELAHECLFFAYLQWVADLQWHAARTDALPVGLFGDLPFMVGGDSADVWANQEAFRLDATVGTPPDSFSETGQDWGLPVYRWEVIEASGDRWIKERAQRSAELFDGYRVDHLVGFYRTYVIPQDGTKRVFSPDTIPAQRAQGERLMAAFASPGTRVIAEDLGTVPDFVRESLLTLGIPGYKVLRWEREWLEEGKPFRDPLSYPAVSVATAGTHDTETLVEWWETASLEERRLAADIPFLRDRGLNVDPGTCDAPTREALLEVLVASASDFVILPMQDIFGWRDRINTPATISDDNWTWRLPWPVEDLRHVTDARCQARLLRMWMHRHERCRALFRREADATRHRT